MKLFIDTTSLISEETGIGRYTRMVACAAARSSLFEAHFGPCDPQAPKSSGSISRLKEALRTYPWLFRSAKTAFSILQRAGRLFSPRFDCYFEPNFILKNSVKSRTAAVTVHDLSCFLYPEWHPLERVRHMERHFEKSLARAATVITVSQAAKKDLMKMFGTEEEKITVIKNGVDHALFSPRDASVLEKSRASLHLPEHFILHVGTVEPRKNLKTLLHAHSLLPAPLRAHFPLLLAGASGWRNQSLNNLIRKARDVHYLGYLPEETLSILYNAADLLCCPSWYEGFGLPVIEAMACGCPTVVSTDPALVETSGPAALHVPPDDAEGLSCAIRQVLEDTSLRTQMRAQGYKRAQAFSWEQSAEAHLDLFLKLCTTS